MACVAVRGHLAAAGSLLLPREPQELSSGHQAGLYLLSHLTELRASIFPLLKNDFFSDRLICHLTI